MKRILGMFWILVFTLGLGTASAADSQTVTDESMKIEESMGLLDESQVEESMDDNLSDLFAMDENQPEGSLDDMIHGGLSADEQQIY